MQRGALTRDQLIVKIVFQLSDLSARNGHHEFEEMCRHLAHQRIAPNVIPATGPVAAGGDQGRDFETFQSYIGQALGDAGWFAGMVVDGPIVGVCTLQKDSIASKILGDVGTVCASEPKPERIYAFLGNDLAVARRHEIIEEARERHGVEIDILDARGIAEQLADFDTFWIAVRYLSLPEQFAPPRPASEGDELPSWYAELRGRWRATQIIPPVSPAELVDLRDGLRYAASSRSAPAWHVCAADVDGNDPQALEPKAVRVSENLAESSEFGVAFADELHAVGIDAVVVEDGR